MSGDQMFADGLEVFCWLGGAVGVGECLCYTVRMMLHGRRKRTVKVTAAGGITHDFYGHRVGIQDITGIEAVI